MIRRELVLRRLPTGWQLPSGPTAWGCSNTWSTKRPTPTFIFRGRKQRVVPLERIEGPWLTAEYAPGDIVLFHSMAVHRALPNRSDRIRLSLDARFQSSSIPRTWQSHKTILELRQCRSIAMEQGASEPVFEALLIEMMKRGLEAEAGVVRALMEEL